MTELTTKTKWNNPPLTEFLVDWCDEKYCAMVKKALMKDMVPVTIENESGFYIRIVRENPMYNAPFYDCVYLLLDLGDDGYMTCWMNVEQEWLDEWDWLWEKDGKGSPGDVSEARECQS